MFVYLKHNQNKVIESITPDTVLWN